jgi:hypothetical protein
MRAMWLALLILLNTITVIILHQDYKSWSFLLCDLLFSYHISLRLKFSPQHFAHLDWNILLDTFFFFKSSPPPFCSPVRGYIELQVQIISLLLLFSKHSSFYYIGHRFSFFILTWMLNALDTKPRLALRKQWEWNLNSHSSHIHHMDT